MLRKSPGKTSGEKLPEKNAREDCSGRIVNRSQWFDEHDLINRDLRDLKNTLSF